MFGFKNCFFKVTDLSFFKKKSFHEFWILVGAEFLAISEMALHILWPSLFYFYKDLVFSHFVCMTVRLHACMCTVGGWCLQRQKRYLGSWS